VPTAPGRVLLVDDHPAVRRVLRSLLEEVGGVGLGLLLVDQLVRGMEGRVWVEDNPLRGRAAGPRAAVAWPLGTFRQAPPSKPV
jgi:signal transduction histidine kinase